MIRGTPGFFGTGIWPYRISLTVGGFAMVVKFGNKMVDHLCRDYLSILYLPLIPLGLSALVDGGRERINLNRESKSLVLTAIQSVRGSRSVDRERKLGGVRQSWVLAFLVAAIGAFLGYAIVFYFLHTWQPSLWSVLGGLLGCVIVNLLYLYVIGGHRI